MSRERIDIWDNAKAILIILVVCGHFAIEFCDNLSSCRTAFFFIYSFHMPAFLFISGLLGKKGVDKLNKNKLIPLLYLAFILNFMRFMSTYITNREMNFSLLGFKNISWYLVLLVLFTLTAHVLKGFPPIYVLCMAMLIGAAAGYDKNLGSFLSLNRYFTYFPFFYMGYIIDEKDIRSLTEKKWMRAAALLLIVGYLILCIRRIDDIYVLRPLFSGLNSYNKLQPPLEPFWGGAYSLIYYPLVMVIILAFIGIVPVRHIGALSVVGKRTVSVYFWHLPLLQLVFDFTPLKDMLNAAGERAIGYMILLAIILAGILCLPPFTTIVNKILRPEFTGKDNRGMIN